MSSEPKPFIVTAPMQSLTYGVIAQRLRWEAVHFQA